MRSMTERGEEVAERSEVGGIVLYWCQPLSLACRRASSPYTGEPLVQSDPLNYPPAGGRLPPLQHPLTIPQKGGTPHALG